MNKTIFITGATDGIGKATACLLANSGHEIIIHSRTSEKGKKIVNEILLSLLKKSQQARIINVSSMIHASTINLNNLQSEMYFDGDNAYSVSKLCNILFTHKLADKLKDIQNKLWEVSNNLVD